MCVAEVALDRRSPSALGVLAADDPDPMLGERRADDLRELPSMPVVELAHRVRDPFEHLGRRQAVGPAGVDPGVDLVVDAGDADHEELVQVGDEDREELQALDQRQRLVLGELQDAVVEVEPRQLAIDEQGADPRARASRPPARDVRPCCRRRRRRGGDSDPLEGTVAQPTLASVSAIAASSAGRISTTSSPLEIPARPPFASAPAFR